MESEACLENPFIYRAMADSCAGMIFHYKSHFKDITSNQTAIFPLSIFHGQSKEIHRFATNQNFGIFGVYLYPFAIPWLCKMPAPELSDEMPHLIDVLGQEGKDLEEKMLLATDNEKRVDIMNAYFTSKLLSSTPTLDPTSLAVNYLIHTGGNIQIKALAEKFSCSPRQFERKFKKYAGYNPKLYARIIRFQSATDQYGSKNLSLTTLAHECGYYDQSHFIHEFKSFSGYHPKTYFKSKTESNEYKDV